MSRRRAAVLIAVHLLIAAHITHWLVAGRTVTPVEPSEAMAFSKGGMINAGLIFFAATIVLTAVFGRFFCGWACHLVALQDLSRWLLEKLGRKPKPLRSRLLRWVPAVAFTYMFLWPLAYRLWIGDSFGHFDTELTTSEFWATFPGWIVGGLTFLICGYAVVYFLGAKGFCTYACPYGAVFVAAERLAPLRIRVTDACKGCAHCTAVCTSNVRVHEEVRAWGMVVDSGCMKCMDCVSVCPNEALYYGAGPIPLAALPRAEKPDRKYPLTLAEEVFLALAFAAGFFSFRGLYGSVPFLMALGLAGVLAYGALLTLQLAIRPHLALKSLRLKRRGTLLPGGYAFLAAMAAVYAFWAHSATVRGSSFVGERAYFATESLRAATLDVGERRLPALTAEDRRTVQRAIRHLQRVEGWGLVPTSGNAARLAWLHLLAGSSAELQSAADRALRRSESVAEMHQILARDAWSRSDIDAAVAGFERALAERPHPVLYLNLGLVLAQSGRLERAGQVFERGLADTPESPLLSYNAALVRALRGDAEGAIALFEATLVLDPENLPARENLAGVLASVGRYEESAAQYRLALRQNPSDPETHLLLGRVLAASGQREEARAAAEEALRLAPGLREAILLLRTLDLQGTD